MLVKFHFKKNRNGMIFVLVCVVRGACTEGEAVGGGPRADFGRRWADLGSQDRIRTPNLEGLETTRKQ